MNAQELLEWMQSKDPVMFDDRHMRQERLLRGINWNYQVPFSDKDLVQLRHLPKRYLVNNYQKTESQSLGHVNFIPNLKINGKYIN